MINTFEEGKCVLKHFPSCTSCTTLW